LIKVADGTSRRRKVSSSVPQTTVAVSWAATFRFVAAKLPQIFPSQPFFLGCQLEVGQFCGLEQKIHPTAIDNPQMTAGQFRDIGPHHEISKVNQVIANLRGKGVQSRSGRAIFPVRYSGRNGIEEPFRKELRPRRMGKGLEMNSLGEAFENGALRL
jgi:hypothetical protein